MGSLRLVLVDDATMTTTTTTRLSLVVAAVGEGPTTRLLELAQVLGQPSPRGTSNTGSTKSVSRICLCASVGLKRILVCISLCTSGSLIVYRSHLYGTWIFLHLHLCPLGEVVCCYSSYSFQTTIACEPFFTPILA